MSSEWPQHPRLAGPARWRRDGWKHGFWLSPGNRSHTVMHVLDHSAFQESPAQNLLTTGFWISPKMGLLKWHPHLTLLGVPE